MGNNSGLKLTPAEEAILTTILYSDIFSFPLTEDELRRFLISRKKISRSEFEVGLKKVQAYVLYKEGYYCLKKREKIIDFRIKNLSEVAKKRERALFVAEKLAQIPSILFIGISGGLAAGNVSEKDDIDLVIIVKKDTLFVSRLLILGLLELLGVRRFRNQKNTANTICVNLLFDETVLSWFGRTPDVYTAREISQIVPLFKKDEIYQKFLLANIWIKEFLPNFVSSSNKLTFLKMWRTKKKNNSDYLLHGNDSNVIKLIGWIMVNPISESFFRKLQISWMKRHQTKEVITEHILAFHPNDYRTQTLTQLRLKMRQFGLLTKF
ncbi:MAG TPA: hypothetical protein VND99_02740 [Candidatus Acidoferrales bacterium]|nr:hypothetical protein [Candidatus Acidoferrales bacterium]